MEQIRISNSTDALLYRILDRICVQTSVLDQVLATQQAQLNILPSIGQSPSQSLSSTTTTAINNVNQAVSNPNNGPPVGFIATSDYPVPIIQINPIYDISSGTALLSPNAFKVTAISTITISVCLDATSNSVYPRITRDNGVTWANLNLGSKMLPGVAYQFSDLFFVNDIFDISFSNNAVLQYLRIAYTYTI